MARRVEDHPLLLALLVGAALLTACGGGGSGPPAADVGADAGTDVGPPADAAGDTPPPADTSFTGSVRIETADGAAPARYRVVVAGGGAGAARRAVTCVDGQGAPDGPLGCAPGGVSFDGAPAPTTITVRAPGWRTVAAAPFASVVTLGALPAFEATADFRTGVTAEDGIEAFRALAFRAQTDLGAAEIVKFCIRDVGGRGDVYFQNTRRHLLHFNFARQFMGFPGSQTDFYRAAYQGEGRTWMAGSLIYYPAAAAESAALGGLLTAPVALTFFPSDDLTPAQAALAHRLIEERLGFLGLDGGALRLVYLPAGAAQEAALRAAVGDFARADAGWVTQTELYGGLTEQLLNPGVAYGTLRRMSPEELAVSVVSFQDVLLLTRLPNELPVVGGTITEELQTPLAHVNVAARSRGTPNLALLGAAGDPRVAPLVGQLVRFEVADGGFTLAATTLPEAQAFWDARGGEPFVPEADLEREGLLPFADIGFADAVAVGAKAANVAELSHLLGAQAPSGFAVPFRYYEMFLATATVTRSRCDAAQVDCLEEGRTAAVCNAARALCEPPEGGQSVRAWLESLLAHPSFAADSAVREATLDAVRHVLRHVRVDPAFAAELDAAVAAAHGTRPVRLRSSTNAEDLPGFSGAGLYSSVAARGGDDPASAEIRKVWASVWNWRAFEERAFWGIDHLAVRMGVAVHEAFPDEAANGVLVTQNIADPTTLGMYVNVQQGETSVTNPEGGALPEIFVLVPAPGGGGVQVQRQRFSSLSPGTPILTDAEVRALYSAAGAVQEHFAPLYGVDPRGLVLDIEFKFHGPERALFLKQVRPYHTAD
jgi:hypothetical protein